MKKTITDELDLLIKRQTKGEEKNLEIELSLVDKLEAELKERKKKARLKMKEEEDKKILKIAKKFMKDNGLKNSEELSTLTKNRLLNEEEQEALEPLLQDGKEVIDQPNKYLDIVLTKQKLSHLYQVFSGE